MKCKELDKVNMWADIIEFFHILNFFKSKRDIHMKKIFRTLTISLTLYKN